MRISVHWVIPLELNDLAHADAACPQIVSSKPTMRKTLWVLTQADAVFYLFGKIEEKKRSNEKVRQHRQCVSARILGNLQG